MSNFRSELKALGFTSEQAGEIVSVAESDRDRARELSDAARLVEAARVMYWWSGQVPSRDPPSFDDISSGRKAGWIKIAREYVGDRDPVETT